MLKKLLLSTVAGAALLSSANATIIQSDSKSLVEIQKVVDAGGYKYYPGVAGKGAKGYLFDSALKEGTVLPKVSDPRALLEAAKAKQIVLIASEITPHICFPVFEEIANQNGVACSTLMSHLADNAKEGSFLSNIDTITAEAESTADSLVDWNSENIVEEVKEAIHPIPELRYPLGVVAYIEDLEDDATYQDGVDNLYYEDTPENLQSFNELTGN